MIRDAQVERREHLPVGRWQREGSEALSGFSVWSRALGALWVELEGSAWAMRSRAASRLLVKGSVSRASSERRFGTCCEALGRTRPCKERLGVVASQDGEALGFHFTPWLCVTAKCDVLLRQRRSS